MRLGAMKKDGKRDGATVRLDAALARSLFKLGRIAQIWPASILLVLAILEVLAVSRVGAIIGQFYSIYVDKDISKFRSVLLESALFYTAVIVTHTASYTAAQFFAVHWRRRITEHLHSLYFQHNVFASLQSLPARDTPVTPEPHHPTTPPPLLSPRGSHSPRTGAAALSIGLLGTDEDALLPGPTSPPAPAPNHSSHRLDNPDQRLTQDISDFCDSLQTFIRKVAKTPFNLVMYTYLCLRLFRSILPVVAALTFFAVFAAVHYTVVATLASAVYANQQQEGDLRAAHLRICGSALPIAAAGGAAIERRHADRSLAAAIASQAWLAWCYSAQQLTATAGDYYAMTMNYTTIGIAVFYGTMSSDAGSQGAAAKDISQASFYLLMLINSLTSILDATKKLGEVAGHTARISEVVAQVTAAAPLGVVTAGSPGAPFELAVPPPPPVTRERLGAHLLRPPAGAKGAWAAKAAGEEELAATGLINAFGNAVPEELAREVETLLPPTAAAMRGGRPLEVSVHRLASVELQEIVRTVFPACPPGASLLAVCTYQSLAVDGARAKLPKQALQRRMDELGESFAVWEATVAANLQAHGGWCDSVDPRTGNARHTAPGTKYSEATGAQVFMRYPVKVAGGLGLIMHPKHGSGTYPVTLFTTAPFVNVMAAVNKACVLEHGEHAARCAVEEAGGTPLLSVYEACVQSVGFANGLRTEHGLCTARAVTFEVQRGQHLMIRGPPGVGKSTFVLALRGLVPLASGVVRWRPGVRAMYLPQNPVDAPGGSLSAQLAYPEDVGCSPQEVVHLLHAVGLGTLAYRFESSLYPDARVNLSRGELQCITIARALRVRPDVAILDEALGAVPIEIELRLLDVLMQAGITIVAISHRDEAVRVAESVLTMDPSFADGWQLDHHPS
eukprot:jgi/Ulvmu1/517/UM001_0525.1